jgi:hypothetical protein
LEVSNTSDPPSRAFFNRLVWSGYVLNLLC